MLRCRGDAMSIDTNSPFKDDSDNLRASPSPEMAKIKTRRYTWAEEVLRSESQVDDSDDEDYRPTFAQDTNVSIKQEEDAEDGQGTKIERDAIVNEFACNIKEEAKPIKEEDDCEIAPDVFVKEEDASVDKKEVVEATSSRIPENRRIAIDFIDKANEEKFERLVKSEKLNTPLKRRHSTASSISSRDTSPSSKNATSYAGTRANKNPVAHIRNSEKRLRCNSQGSTSSSSSYTETDPIILSRRQKQIEYGKNTIAYDRYVEIIPKHKRSRIHPRTPNKYGKYSRRAFDGLVKIWRKQLHHYDPPEDDKDSSAEVEDEDDHSDLE